MITRFVRWISNHERQFNSRLKQPFEIAQSGRAFQLNIIERQFSHQSSPLISPRIRRSERSNGRFIMDFATRAIWNRTIVCAAHEGPSLILELLDSEVLEYLFYRLAVRATRTMGGECANSLKSRYHQSSFTSRPASA